MLEHSTGMIGLPLRLLAREVYDRVTARVGEAPVALVTGEEKRIPARPRYWICTVEAMPTAREVDFLAVDEIQLAAHRERGHVFTDRLLRARGREETWFLGSATMRPLVERLVPTARAVTHPRLSKLRSAGTHSLGKLPPRSAVVVFSMPRVYEMAERIRNRRGGAAVVLGALSPRARNAQVAMFQAGEVDYLVATDAIGMGLNLSLDHVAFADLRKFDGKETRPLEAHELAQIAGRAGRHLNDGSFATLAPLPALPERLAFSIEAHHFPAEKRLFWRNADLDTTSLQALLASLSVAPRPAGLELAPRASDFEALRVLATRPEIRRRASRPDEVALLWDVCQVPDYRKLLVEQHANLVGELFVQLADRGTLDRDWLAGQIQRSDDIGGDIDALLQRMEAVRTWTYVSSHARWVSDAESFRQTAQGVEDRLSDALHHALVERFVERGRKARRRAVAAPDHPFGALATLRSALDGDAPETDAIEPLVDAEHARFRADSSGKILDVESGRAIAVLTRGTDPLHPEVRLSLDLAGSGARARLQRRLVAWARDLVSDLFAPLRAAELAELSGPARGLVYQLEQSLGTVLTEDARAQIDALDARDRQALERAGVEIGGAVVFVRPLLRGSELEKRAALVAAYARSELVLPPVGAVSVAVGQRAPRAAYLALGFPVFGPRAIRADAAERAHRTLISAPPEPGMLGRVASLVGCKRAEAEKVVRELAPSVTLPRPPKRARRRAPAPGA